MKTIHLCLLLVLVVGQAAAQTITGRSAQGYINITKDPVLLAGNSITQVIAGRSVESYLNITKDNIELTDYSISQTITGRSAESYVNIKKDIKELSDYSVSQTITSRSAEGSVNIAKDFLTNHSISQAINGHSAESYVNIKKDIKELTDHSISQTITGRSLQGYVNIIRDNIILVDQTSAQKINEPDIQGSVIATKEPPKLPYIEIIQGSLQFTDDNGNNFIDANEQSSFMFQVINTGLGEGLNLTAKIEENNASSGLSFSHSKTLGNLQPGEILEVKVPVSAGMGTRNGKASFAIAIDEANGFGTDPIYIEVPTRAFLNPMVKVVDYKVTNQEGTTIQKRKPFDVQLLVQNTGQGTAEDIAITVPLPVNINCLSDSVIIIKKLDPGESALIDYSLVATVYYSDPEIKLDFRVSEKYGNFSEGKEILIGMNQQVTSEKLVIKGITQQQTEIKVGSLTSSVDKNIPVNDTKYPYRVALIIGNEDYSGTFNAEVNVPYALNDAQVFRDYALNTLGVEPRNLHILTDATSGQMRSEIEWAAKIVKAMGPAAELIFYYAGHGYPDEATRVPYLIPVDVNATNLSAAIKLSEVYEKFGNSGAQRVTIFLDACFSGGGRNQGLLAARSVKQKPKEETVTGNMVVFSASSGEQSSLSYDSEKHGMFTYFLLKKLQESRGMLTYVELDDYLKYNVPVESLRENNKEQNPEVIVSSSVFDTWNSWRFFGK